ncbi:MAG TPA: serine/threonine-protein kinase [Gemmatimonadales bacterium]|nr:serine/threonine-protein kinase [Gemmatimonadales bacterium]
MTNPPPPTEHPERIGPYRVIRVLGEGGMGLVYEAEQTVPVRRRVALKVMKQGMDTREVIARFEAERQALAVMQHPGIAQVYDGGASDAGRPYFAMELVDGTPITTYCDAHRLALAERLALFIKVCEAVQHAHQKGVIHRDLKPSNILVTEVDGEAAPKIIDFGIAKAIGFQLTEETLVTSFGSALGTLAYMSPEQAEMSLTDVDTRADIYSLGVVLYELLVGELPIDPAALGAQRFLHDLVTGATNTPRPSRIRRVLKGDLDWIVLKALEYDRNRRYESAAALGGDLRHYLEHEPVAARPPTTWYRFGRFTRRNRVAVAAGVAVTAALVVGLVVATVGFVRASRAERTARTEAATAKQVSDFMTSMFDVADPSAAGGKHLSAVDVLDAGAQRIRTELKDQPLVRARLLMSIANAYRNIGELPRATRLGEEAVRLFDSLPGAPPLDVAKAKAGLAVMLNDAGGGPRVEPLEREALAIFDRQLGNTWDAQRASVAAGLAFEWNRTLRYGAADSLLTASLQRHRGLGDDEGVAQMLNELCRTRMFEHELTRAHTACDSGLAISRRLHAGPNWTTSNALQYLALVEREEGQYDSSLAAFRESLAMRDTLYGGRAHVLFVFTTRDMAVTFERAGMVDSALHYARTAATLARTAFPDGSQYRQDILAYYAHMLNRTGDRAGALAVAREMLAQDQRYAADHRADLDAAIRWLAGQARYAVVARAAGHAEEARAATVRSRAIADSLAQLAPKDRTTALDLNALCWWGSLAGSASRVLGMCDAAMRAADENTRTRILDSRGVARALAGDDAGAIQDFEAYIARSTAPIAKAQREAWVAELKGGRNPFTADVLGRLMGVE